MTPELQRLVSGPWVSLSEHPLPESSRWSLRSEGLDFAGVEPLAAGRPQPAGKFRLDLYGDPLATGVPLLSVERRRIPLLRDALAVVREGVVMAQLIHRARPLNSYEELLGPDERVIGRATAELPVTFTLGVAECARLTAEPDGSYRLTFTPGSDTVQRPLLLAAAWGWLHRKHSQAAAKATKAAAKAAAQATKAAAKAASKAATQAAAPEPAPKPDPKPAPEVEPRVDPQPAPEHDPLPPPVPAGDPQPQPTGDPGNAPQSEPTAELSAKAEPSAELEPEAKPEPVVEPKLEASRPKTKAERKAERRAAEHAEHPEPMVIATVVTVETVEVETSK